MGRWLTGKEWKKIDKPRFQSYREEGKEIDDVFGERCLDDGRAQ